MKTVTCKSVQDCRREHLTKSEGVVPAMSLMDGFRIPEWRGTLMK